MLGPASCARHVQGYSLMLVLLSDCSICLVSTIESVISQAVTVINKVIHPLFRCTFCSQPSFIFQNDWVAVLAQLTLALPPTTYAVCRHQPLAHNPRQYELSGGTRRAFFAGVVLVVHRAWSPGVLRAVLPVAVQRQATRQLEMVPGWHVCSEHGRVCHRLRHEGHSGSPPARQRICGGVGGSCWWRGRLFEHCLYLGSGGEWHSSSSSSDEHACMVATRMILMRAVHCSSLPMQCSSRLQLCTQCAPHP